MASTLPRIGWIGLGNIGLPMAQRVASAGFPLDVWARQAGQTASLVAAGASLAAEPEALARECDVVVTIVGGPDDVRSLAARILPNAKRGAVYIDMTTAAPSNADEARELATTSAVDVLDAPVTGGVGGAQRGALTSFVGGDAEILERVRPLLAAFSSRIVHAGPHGAGYRMKLVNQAIVAGTLLGLAGGAALARQGGFASASVKEALAAGTAAGFLFDSYVTRMIDRTGPVTFTLAMLRKDLTLARAELHGSAGIAPFLDDALATVEAACARHGEGAGVQALAGTD